MVNVDLQSQAKTISHNHVYETSGETAHFQRTLATRIVAMGSILEKCSRTVSNN